MNKASLAVTTELNDVIPDVSKHSSSCAIFFAQYPPGSDTQMAYCDCRAS